MLSAENNENKDVLFLRFVGRNKLLVSLGRFDEAAASCREGAEKFEKEPGPFSSYMLTFIYNRLGIISLLTCIHTKAFDYLPYFKKASDYYNENPVPVRGPITHTNVTAYVCQISYPAEKGQYERSISAIREAIPYTDNSLSGLLYGVDDLAQAEFDYFRGNLSGAEQYARQAVLKAREKQQYEIESRGLFFLLRIALNAGNSKDVQDILGQLNAQLETEEYLNRFTLYDIITGWFYAQIGLPSRVAPWLRDDAGGDDEAKNFLYDLETLVKAKCFFVEKRYAESSKVLKHWIPQTPPGFLLGRLEMTLLEALNCHYLEAGPEKAAGAFRTAYVISASNSFDMPFIELGEDMRLLSRDGKNSGIPPAWLEAVQNKASAYGKKILMAAGEFLETERNGKTAPYLTRREREVLGGLSQGLTREEIAEGSSISLNTVKSVIRSVYNKLGAINRADAVRIATSMGLLKTGH
jgi:LuxR family maltose regulon positive regulatory protein